MTIDPVSDALVGQISGLLDGWTQALVDGDVARIRSFMTDDFSITTAGWLDTPADGATWLSHASARFRLDWFSYDDVRVRQYGGDGVVVSQSRCRQRGTDLATHGPWAMVFRYTDVWVPDGGGWQIDVRQATGRPWTEADDRPGT